jgi:hypothetical protein
MKRGWDIKTWGGMNEAIQKDSTPKALNTNDRVFKTLLIAEIWLMLLSDEIPKEPLQLLDSLFTSSSIRSVRNLQECVCSQNLAIQTAD